MSTFAPDFWDNRQNDEKTNKYYGIRQHGADSWCTGSISYRVCECGCEIYYVHDEGNFFPEEVAVSSSGEPFEDACDDIYTTLKDAINDWCEKMHIEQGERTDEEMMDFINEYEYDDDDTYFYIRQFTFE